MLIHAAAGVRQKFDSKVVNILWILMKFVAFFLQIFLMITTVRMPKYHLNVTQTLTKDYKCQKQQATHHCPVKWVTTVESSFQLS